MRFALTKRLGSLIQVQCRQHVQTAPRVPTTNPSLKNDHHLNSMIAAASQMAPKIVSVSPDAQKRMVQVDWEDGKIGHFPFVWLRDCAPLAARPQDDPKCPIAASTRTLTLNELNIQITPEKLTLDQRGETISIQWPPYLEVDYKSDWLREHLLSIPSLSVSEKRMITHWGRTEMEKHLPQTTVDELNDRRVLREKLLEFAKYGVLLIHGGCTDDLRALKSLGYRQADMEPNKFRAYSHQVQGMHTGGAYRPSVPPLCMLFVREEPEDSKLQICDGYRVADQLRQAHPAMFTFLCNTLIEYKVVGKSGQLKSHKWPVFTLTASGAVQQVAFNNALRSSRITVTPESLEDYYQALKTFNSYCYQSRNRYNLLVQKGDLVILANQRVLHGNPAFGDNVINWVDEVFVADEPLMATFKSLQQQQPSSNI